MWRHGSLTNQRMIWLEAFESRVFAEYSELFVIVRARWLNQQEDWSSQTEVRGRITYWLIYRSQWSSGSMSDCSAQGPGIESRCGQHNHCDLQPWARAVCTFPAVPRSTQPSTLCGTVNEYQLSGWVIIINGDGDASCLKQADSQPKSCGLVWGSAAAWRCSTFTR